MTDQEFRDMLLATLTDIKEQGKERYDRLEKRLDAIESRVGGVERDVGWVKGKLEGKQEEHTHGH